MADLYFRDAVFLKVTIECERVRLKRGGYPASDSGVNPGSVATVSSVMKYLGSVISVQHHRCNEREECENNLHALLPNYV